jgi:L,D-transpeptidase YcbB
MDRQAHNKVIIYPDMEYHRNAPVFFALLFIVFTLAACGNSGNGKPSQLVNNPGDMDAAVSGNLEEVLAYALAHNGKIDDSTRLRMAAVVNVFYQKRDFDIVWSRREQWQPLADSLYRFIETAELQGLFPNDYHFKQLRWLKRLLDSNAQKRTDAVLWTRADLLLTDGLMGLMQDLKQGRLQADSLGLANKPAMVDGFFAKHAQQILEKKALLPVLEGLQPRHRGYQELKRGIPRFLDSMDRRVYTYVHYPYKDSTDSIRFVKLLQKRLHESNCIDLGGKRPDSLQLQAAVKKYQKLKGLKADGKINTALMRVINTNDMERFKRIAITLDRYKQLPEKMPERFIWVNLPGYYLQVWDHDTLAMESRTVVGKPGTPTPQLTSTITNMVTYPTWTVPTSIIAKEMLPGLKRNPGYLARRGLKLLNAKGQPINPASVNWAKYSKGIPFRIQQGSGDGNALGIFKFNFDNPFAVYLHDTNQRYLFKNASRALSHGCVRVQDWQKLAFYIATLDSVSAKPTDSLRYTTDSIRSWLAHKNSLRMEVKSKVPLYIRYFSCEGKDGKIKFYDDIYGDDKALREQYFTDRP